MEVLGQVHPLSQNTLQAVVHGQEVRVAVALVVAAAVEAFDVGPQSTLLGLEVPGTSVQICSKTTNRSSYLATLVEIQLSESPNNSDLDLDSSRS